MSRDPAADGTRVIEGLGDRRIAQHRIALALVVPAKAMNSKVPPMLVAQISVWLQHRPEIVFALLDRRERCRHVADVATDPPHPGRGHGRDSAPPALRHSS